MNNHSERVNFIWSIADLIRDSFKRGKYQDIILPLTVLRRLDCVLAPTKQQVLETNAKLKGKRVMERFKNVDVHPDKISNEQMGYIFEEIVRTRGG